MMLQSQRIRESEVHKYLKVLTLNTALDQFNSATPGLVICWLSLAIFGQGLLTLIDNKA